MNNVNKTLYIPLYGKAYVSKKQIILHDPKAEEIWNKEGFQLKGKSKSKWLAYYMGMRSSVFDHWLRKQMNRNKDAIILHIGCGMDSRNERIGYKDYPWYDIDFHEVIQERKRYYHENEDYHMIEGDVRNQQWLEMLPNNTMAIIVMEGVSMYLKEDELIQLFKNLSNQFAQVHLLMDCYTTFAAKASKYKNPINDVGVRYVYGIDNPKILENNKMKYKQEHELTPLFLINELKGLERTIFKYLYAGKLSKRMYRLYEYQTIER